MGIDFSTYSLKELREAWLTIDDYLYPDRAIEIYLRLKQMESEVEEVNPLDKAPNWFIDILSFFYRPPKFYETTFNDELLEQSNADMKEERIKILISERRSKR